MADELPAGWGQARFGDRCHELGQEVVKALQEAVRDAQNAQKVSTSSTRHPFGWTLFSRYWDTISAALANMEGVFLVKPKGSPFPLPLVDGCLLYPFRYAEDSRTPVTDARMSDSVRVKALFEKLAPPQYLQDALFLAKSEPEDAMDDVLGPDIQQLPDDTRLVLVPFACNDQAGLIKAWWGEAELLDDRGHLRWIGGPEQLRVPLEPAVGGLQLLSDGHAPTQPLDRFDDAEIPEIETRLRPPGQPLDGGEILPGSGSSETDFDEQQ